MPEAGRAPWINIESSVFSTDWSKLVNQEQFSDVIFHVGVKQFYAHRYVLCSGSDVMRQLLGVKTAIKPSSLSECVQWPTKRLKALTPDRINNGQEEGFISFVTENQ